MAKSQDGNKERAARYRELAGLFLKLAIVITDKTAHAAYLKLAYSWNALAAETEYLH